VCSVERDEVGRKAACAVTSRAVEARRICYGKQRLSRARAIVGRWSEVWLVAIRMMETRCLGRSVLRGDCEVSQSVSVGVFEEKARSVCVC
jgi:hypothetical protein